MSKTRKLSDPSFATFHFPSDRAFALWRDEVKALDKSADCGRRLVKLDGTTATVCCWRGLITEVVAIAAAHGGVRAEA